MCFQTPGADRGMGTVIGLRGREAGTATGKRKAGSRARFSGVAPSGRLLQVWG